MGSPTFGAHGAHFEQPKLAIVVYRRAGFAPTDDVYTENPTGAFRGLAFAIGFNVLLVLAGAAGWALWRMIR